MKILETRYIRAADAYTIENEPISSIKLMERASREIFHCFLKHFPEPVTVCVFAGPGNNGGDGIALSRMLAENNYPVKLFILDLGKGLSADGLSNLERLPKYSWLRQDWLRETSFPEILPNEVFIDALFGSGLNKPLSGYPATLVNRINGLSNTKISIDIPSGLFGEDNSENPMKAVIRADITITLHCPKLSFSMPENEAFVGKVECLPIGLNQEFVDTLPSAAELIDLSVAKSVLKSRSVFSHKGDFGHALLIAGSAGKSGAAMLSALACLKTGVGLLTCHVPKRAEIPMQSIVPEAMLDLDVNDNFCSSIHDIQKYTVLGIGPGLGTENHQKELLEKLLTIAKVPMVLDADALNILSANPKLLDSLPPKTILTPHPGEYKRLFGEDKNHFHRLQRLRDISRERELIIILKGASTAVANSRGELWINSTGNPGMATAGSGDVLTGIVLSLLAQQYSPEKAAILAVFLHGLAGDLASESIGQHGLIARNIIDNLGSAFLKILNDNQAYEK